jgi:polysaccharide biosynthesis protein PslG
LIRNSTLLAILAVALLGPPASAAAAPAPPGFTVGISPQTPAGDADYALMAEAGVKSLRLPLGWASVEPQSPYFSPPDWSGFDRSVALAAEYGMRVFPFVSGSPPWVAGREAVEPVRQAWAGRAWRTFLREAVRRYGSHGSFWRENPELPFLPIQAWEIWNEENIVTFSVRPDPGRYARLLRIAGRAIHGADPGAKAILGGLFGRPLQVPPNVPSGAFLGGVYRAGHVKPFFDGVALHPYVADVAAMRPQIVNLRRIMRVHHDAATPLYVTELGWGSDSYQTRWERGLYGQARELDSAFSMLADHRHAWRVAGGWWFSWADAGRLCQFCDSAGLLTDRREAKPAWYRFTEWTGGDAAIVPRASFGQPSIPAGSSGEVEYPAGSAAGPE